MFRLCLWLIWKSCCERFEDMLRCFLSGSGVEIENVWKALAVTDRAKCLIMCVDDFVLSVFFFFILCFCVLLWRKRIFGVVISLYIWYICIWIVHSCFSFHSNVYNIFFLIWKWWTLNAVWAYREVNCLIFFMFVYDVCWFVLHVDYENTQSVVKTRWINDLVVASEQCLVFRS